MKNNIKIAKYNKTEEGFELTGYDEYIVTYLKSPKVHMLRVVVNGKITERRINIVEFRQGYRDILLSAISDYKHDRIKDKNSIVRKFITLGTIQQFYSKLVIRNIQNNLINISKVENRDELTKYNLY